MRLFAALAFVMLAAGCAYMVQPLASSHWDDKVRSGGSVMRGGLDG